MNILLENRFATQNIYQSKWNQFLWTFYYLFQTNGDNTSEITGTKMIHGVRPRVYKTPTTTMV